MTRKNIKFDVNPLFSGPSMSQRAQTGSPFRELSIGEIDVDPDQPRRVFDTEQLAELSASIKEHGVLCPILVKVTAGGSYRVVAGERRLRAAKMAGLGSIPAVIDTNDATDDQLARQLVENLQREDLTPMERALAIGQLRERNGWSIREIAKKLGISKGLVQRSLEILELPDDLQAALIAGAAESKVTLLAQIGDRQVRRLLIEQLDYLTRSQIEEEIAEIKEQGVEVYHGGTPRGGKKGKENMSVEDKRIIEDIQRALGTKVRLSRLRNKEGAGKLTVDFYSDSDLNEIFRRLTG